MKDANFTNQQQLVQSTNPVLQWLRTNKGNKTTDRKHPQGTVYVEIIGADGIRAADGKRKDSTSDPFVKVVFSGKVMGKTAVIKKTLSPRWDPNDSCFSMPRQPTSVESSAKGSEIVLEMYDYDRVGLNDFLGEVRLKVVDLPYDRRGGIRPQNIQYKLDADGIRVEPL